MDRLEVIEALKQLPVLIEVEIEGMSASALRARPAEGEWSITEVIGHLLDHTRIWNQRFYMISSQNDPILPTYDGDASVREHNYQDADVRQLIAEIRRLRLESVGTLAHTVDWSRLGQRPGVGRRSLLQWALDALSHESDHLTQPSGDEGQPRDRRQVLADRRPQR